MFDKHNNILNNLDHVSLARGDWVSDDVTYFSQVELYNRSDLSINAC